MDPYIGGYEVADNYYMHYVGEKKRPGYRALAVVQGFEWGF
jgi:hypothetical protein